MAKTQAERAASYRKRRKEAGLGSSDHSERMKAHRELIKKNKCQYTAHKQKDAARKRLARQDKKNQAAQVVTPAPTESAMAGYKSVQSFGKAVRRASKGLPQSPTKRRSVVRALARSCGVLVVSPCTDSTKPISEDKMLRDDTVRAFYRRDGISWQSPCTQQRVIVREKNAQGKTMRKTYVQKRFLLMSVKEAYQLFIAEHTQIPVKITKFSALRPAEVEFFTHIPHNVCVCQFHANMGFILHALEPFVFVPTLVASSDEFLRSVTCDPSNKKCAECKFSVEGFNPKHIAPNASNIRIKCEQRLTTPAGRVELQEVECSLQECFDDLKKKLPHFLEHESVKRSQQKFFEDTKKSVNAQSIVLQVDFAENYALKMQNEVQSAYWAHSQCTLFTAHAWIDQEQEEGFVTVSNDLVHGKYSVYKMMDTILSHLDEQIPCLREVPVFSDGAASQFKQKFLFSTLHIFEQRYGISMHWHFFATAHGKGVIDGHGGTVKGAVWRRTAAGAKVTSAKDFAVIAKEACPNINILYVSLEETEENMPGLDEHWERLKGVPGTRRIHSVKPAGPFIIEVREESTCPHSQIVTRK